MQLTELSRKLETTLEQVLPFVPKQYDEDKKGLPASTVNNSDAENAVLHPPQQSGVYTTEGEFVNVSDRLSNFYRKFNKVLLDNIAIENEKQRLLKENSQLEDLIQQYLDGTKVSSLTLSEDNPLFVVNGRANLNHILPVKRDKNLVVQDCVNIFNTVNRQLK